MSKSLPERPNREHLKNEAKALLASQETRDRGVCETLRHLPKFAWASDEEILSAKVTLQEVQHALGREYGFAGWKEIKEHVTRRSAVNERLQQAMAVFSSKGPDDDSTGSAWEHGLDEERRKLLEAGDEGFEVMRELARSSNGRARNAAAICFGLSEDPRALESLRAMFADEAVTVRSRAVRFYAVRLHPSCRKRDVWDIREPAETVPPGVEAVFPRIRDTSVKVRMDAIAALSAYAGLSDEPVLTALRQALSDSEHKVQHYAAGVLRLACPRCGTDPRKGSPKTDPVPKSGQGLPGTV